MPAHLLVVLGLAVCASVPVQASELLPYSPPGANSPTQRSLGARRPPSTAQRSPDADQSRTVERARVTRDQLELSVYYRQKAEEAHRRGDIEAERFYLQRWNEVVGQRR